MEQLGAPARRHAQARRGDPRPARASPSCGAGRCASSRRAAAAGRDRLRAHHAPAGARARRADLGARPDRPPRRCSPPSPGSCTTSAVTVVMAEHRLERVVQYADRRGPTCRRRPGRGSVLPAEVLAPRRRSRRPWSSSAGWRAGARCRCRCATPAAGPATCATRLAATPTGAADAPTATAALRGRRGVSVRYGDVGRRCTTSTSTLRAGEVTALMGRNGAGKSSLLWALQGTGARDGGHASTSAVATPAELGRPDARRALVGLVPQTAGRPAVPRRPSPRSARRPTARPARPRAPARPARPRGARRPRRRAPARPLRGAAAGARARRPAHRAPGRAAARRADPRPRLRRQGGAGPGAPRTGRRRDAVLLSTHDVEFVAEAADRVVMMAEGEVVVDGPAAEVWCPPRPSPRRSPRSSAPRAG